MQTPVRRLGRLAPGIALALGLFASTQAQQATPVPAAPAGPPAGFVAPAEPAPGESNAARARSQPGNNAPFWRAVRRSGEQQGYTSLPGPEEGTLIQRFVRYPGTRYTTAGEAWREVRNRWIIPYGGSLLLITTGALALYYWRRGAIGGKHPDTGRKIERFTPFERSAHWANAIAFVILAVSGLTMAFGKFFLVPVLGRTLFGWLTYVLKTAHNLVGPLFAVSLVVVFFTFMRDEWPRKGDLAWIRQGGGLFGGTEVPSHRFNAGEKIIFWGGVFLLGPVAVVSGLVLDRALPGLDYLRGDMQLAHIVHSTAVMLMMVLLIGHIYLGTIGTKGAYRGMRTGYVDEAYAQEHHELWFNDVKAGRIPAVRSAQTAAPAVRSAGAST
jgi:formate dehydrogenase subunit gamma